jgi:hypothetical protein
MESVFCNINNSSDINSELLLHRVPIHLGGISDPFSSEENTKRTLDIISILNSFDYPLIISSKQTNNIVREDVLTELKKMKYLTLQISIPIPDDKLSHIIEPGAPIFSRRIDHMKTLHDQGFCVVARVQPVIPPLVNTLLSDGIPAIIQTGCSHIIMECLKLPVEKSELFDNLFDALHWNGHDHYSKMGAFIVGRDRVLPPEVALETTNRLVELLMRSGLTYGITDHGLFHLGNTSCCCGVANKKGFDGIFKANFTNIIRTKKSNLLYFSDVTKFWIPQKTISKYINSHSRLPKDNSFLTHLMDKWNKPGNVNAPDAFIGVKYTGEKDINGNCIYDKSNINSFIPNIIN